MESCPLTCQSCGGVDEGDGGEDEGDGGGGDECEDSTSWFFKKTKNTCDKYVGKDPSSRCKKKDASKVKASEACPSICSPACAPESAKSDDAEEAGYEESCFDSTSWYTKKEKNNCDYISKKPSDRCSKKDENKVKAQDACFKTCGSC